MPVKRITYGQDARLRMLRGLAVACRAAAVTMGPKGRYVAVDRHYGPPMLRDGVGAVRAIELSDRVGNIGVSLARQVAVRTSDEVGDGTTCACVLLHALAIGGMRLVGGGLDPAALCAGMEAATAAAQARLAALARPVAEGRSVEAIATVAANGDPEIGALVQEAMEAAGDDGLLTVRVGTARETSMATTSGYALETRFIADPLAVAVKNGLRELEDVLVLVVDGPVASFDAITPLLEEIISLEQPLLIVAEDIGPTALAGLVENKRGDIIDVACVRSTVSGERRSELLRDIAIFSGAELIEPARGMALESAGAAVLGRAERVVFTATETLLAGGGGDPGAVEERRLGLAAAVDGAGSDHERDALRRRIAHLGGRMVTVEVGGATELEAKERRDRIDNAVKAAKSALRDGVVAGGGVALLAAAEALAELPRGDLAHAAAIDLVGRALEAPARRILKNAALDSSAVLGRIRGHYPIGHDVSAGKDRDLIEAGIVDAAGVLAAALAGASAMAQLLLRTECVVASAPPKT